MSDTKRIGQTDKERIEAEVGIKEGDTWTSVLIAVLLWLDKRLPKAQPLEHYACESCGMLHHLEDVGNACSNHPMCRGRVKTYAG